MAILLRRLQSHAHVLAPPFAHNREGHGVMNVELSQCGMQVFRVGDRLAVEGHNDVAEPNPTGLLLARPLRSASRNRGLPCDS